MQGWRNLLYVFLATAFATPALAEEADPAIQLCKEGGVEIADRMAACSAVIEAGEAPNISQFRVVRGYLLLGSGDAVGGFAELDEVMASASGDFDTSLLVGTATAAAGHPAEALAYYDAVIAQFPLYARVYNEKAWLLVTSPNGEVRNGAEAILLAQKAVELHDTAAYRDTLAAAYAEAGDFARAVEEQEHAISMLSEHEQESVVEAFEARLALFRQGRPLQELQ